MIKHPEQHKREQRPLLKSYIKSPTVLHYFSYLSTTQTVNKAAFIIYSPQNSFQQQQPEGSFFSLHQNQHEARLLLSQHQRPCPAPAQHQGLCNISKTPSQTQATKALQGLFCKRATLIKKKQKKCTHHELAAFRMLSGA